MAGDAVRSLIAAAAAALLAAPALAREPTPHAVYKFVLPDGGVLYSDERPPAGRLEEVVPAPPAPAITAHPNVAPGAPVPRAMTLEAASRDVAAAERALARAQAALDQGQAPEPGERLGNANGTSRLGPAYWARQSRLREQVALARQRLADARAEIDAYR